MDLVNILSEYDWGSLGSDGFFDTIKPRSPNPPKGPDLSTPAVVDYSMWVPPPPADFLDGEIKGTVVQINSSLIDSTPTILPKPIQNHFIPLAITKKPGKIFKPYQQDLFRAVVIHERRVKRPGAFERIVDRIIEDLSVFNVSLTQDDKKLLQNRLYQRSCSLRTIAETPEMKEMIANISSYNLSVLAAPFIPQIRKLYEECRDMQSKMKAEAHFK